MWLLALLSCANGIMKQYEQEKSEVLADPGPAGARWTPELRVRLSDDTLDTLAGVALAQGLLDLSKKLKVDGPLGVTAEVNPEAKLGALSLRAGDCDACLEISATLEGDATWKLGSLKGELPFTADIGGTLSFSLSEDNGVWTGTGRIKSIDKVKVKAGKSGDLDLGSVLSDWINSLASKAPPIELGTFGGADMPLRAMRLSTTGGLLGIEALTDVGGGADLKGGDGELRSGVELAISSQTALALMRREAFKAGALAYDVAADPRSLRIKGDEFTLGLRLWKLASRGWWRDYTVTGQIKVTPKKLKLLPADAKEGEKSDGAGLADPLALLAEGQILEAVEEGLAQSMPTATSSKVGAVQLRLAVDKVNGEGDTLLVHSRVVSSESSSDEAPSGGGRSGQKRKSKAR